MRLIRVDVSELPPHIAAHLRSVAPHARAVEVSLRDNESATVTIGSQQWSDGSRELYTIASLDPGLPFRQVEDNRPWPQNMGALGETAIPPRCVIIKTGTFCGKPTTPYIYARADDVAAQLASPDVPLTHMESQVLKAVATLNSSGRKRFRDDFRMSRETWDATVTQLVAKGLATPRGSATTEGANRSRSISDSILNPFSPESGATES